MLEDRTVREHGTSALATRVEGLLQPGDTIVISTRTPEGRPNHCPVCGSDLRIEPSGPAGDGPCPRCGHLLWFTWEALGDVHVIKPGSSRLETESLVNLLERLAIRPGIRLVIDFSDVQYLAESQPWAI